MRLRSLVAAALPLFLLEFWLPPAALAAPAKLEFIGVGVGSTATQVAVRLSAGTQYTVNTLAASGDRPHRLYIDFTNTKLGPGTTDERPVVDGAVARVRAGQFDSSTARVVLDLRDKADYRIETHQNPFRLVIRLDNAPVPPRPGVDAPEIDEAPAPDLVPGPPADDRVFARAELPAAQAAPAPEPAAPGRPEVAVELEPEPGTASEVTDSEVTELARLDAPVEPAPPGEIAPPAEPAVGAVSKPDKAAAEPIADTEAPAEDGPATEPTADTEAPAGDGTAAEPVADRTADKAADEDAPLAVAKFDVDVEFRGEQTPRITGNEPDAAAAKPDGTEMVFIAPPAAADDDRLANIPAQPAFPDPLRVVIDPGHGGRDPGAQSVDGTWEKDIVLAMAQELALRTRRRLDVNVVLTRTGDEFVSLDDRAAFTTGQDSIFISVHGNVCPESWVEGVQTFYPEGGTFAPQSRRLAHLVHHRIVTAIDRSYGPVRDGGVRARGLAVLERSQAPSLLLEAGYLSNPVDRQRLDDDDYRSAFMDGVVDGIADYLSGVRDPGQLMVQRDPVPSPYHARKPEPYAVRVIPAAFSAR